MRICYRLLLLGICMSVGVASRAQVEVFVPVGTPVVNADMVDGQKDKLKRSFSVSGRLVDSVYHTPIPFAGVVLLDTMGVRTIAQSISDEAGRFAVRVDDSGTYLLRIIVFGNMPWQKRVRLSLRHRKIELGDLAFRYVVGIDSVSVTTVKKLIRVDMDKIVYNVADDPFAKGAPLFDVMRSVPLVSTDGQDELTLNGQSNFLVLVDGKRNAIFKGKGFALSSVMKAYPADAVESIEVMTIPPPRYEAEGIGGVINVVTKRSKVNGYSVGVNTLATSLGTLSAGATAMLKYDRFSMSLFGSVSRNDTGMAESWTERENFGSDRNRLWSNYHRNDQRERSLFGILHMSYDIDSLRLLTAGVDFGHTETRADRSGVAGIYDRSGLLTRRYDTYDDVKSPSPRLTVNVEYQRSFRKKERMLTFAYLFDRSADRADNLRTLMDFVVTGADIRRDRSHTLSFEHTGQVDYSDVFNRRHEVSAGGKYICRRYATGSSRDLFDATGNVWSKDPSYVADRLGYVQQIFSGYGNYTLKGSKFGGRIGFRAEYADNDARAGTGEQENRFSNAFFNFMPNVSFYFVLSGSQNLNAGYTHRVGRPSVSMLNPYRNDADPSYIYYGNPDLEPESAHTFNVQWGYYRQRHAMSLTFSSVLCNNKIFYYARDHGDGVKEMTYGNVGKKNDFMLYFYYTYRTGRNFECGINGHYGYTRLGDRTNSDSFNSGWHGALNFRIRTALWKNAGINGFATYLSDNILLQGERSSCPSYSLQLYQNFLENRLRVSATAAQFFNQYYTTDGTTETSEFREVSEFRRRARFFNLAVSFTFGKMDEKVKKSGRVILNDDLITQ